MQQKNVPKRAKDVANTVGENGILGTAMIFWKRRGSKEHPMDSPPLRRNLQALRGRCLPCWIV